MLRAAGPCNNFESLHQILHAVELKAMFDSASTQATLDSTWKSIKAVFNHWDELLQSCRTAVTELKKAVEGKISGKKPKARAKSKPKPKAKAAPMFKAFDATYDADNAIPTFDHAAPGDHNMSFPFIVNNPCGGLLTRIYKGYKEDAEAGPIVKDVQEFQVKFGTSDLRFTAGKAQRSMPEELQTAIGNSLMAVMGNHAVLHARKWQPPSTFACVKDNRSFQYEVGAFGCLRFCLQGTSPLDWVSSILLIFF